MKGVSLSDRLMMRFQGYGEKLGLRFKTLDIDPFEEQSQNIPDCEKHKTPMHEAFYGNSGETVHKWRGYLEIYDKHLSRFRNLPVRILELGVYRGGSLNLWRSYFGKSAIIYGIDIDRECRQYDGLSGRVRIGSQDDPGFLKSVVGEMGGVDVVIDDGSHIASHQKSSFYTLYPLLDKCGIYLCEDTMTAYYRGYFGGGFQRRTNFIEIAKNIIDDLNSDFHNRVQTVPNAHREIAGIHFYQSMVVIEKSPQPIPSHMKIPLT